MIISRGRRYIFVHIPKTGGTALTLALEERARKDDILIGDTPKAKRRRGRLKDLAPAGRLWKHSTLADIDGIVGAGELDGYFVLTLVRNPLDRAVSYYHWLRAQDFPHPAVALAKDMGFAEFLLHPTVQQSLAAAPYGRYVTASDGREHCRLYARLEHLDEDLAAFETHLGFRLGPIVPANPSERARDYRIYYSDRTAEVVGRVSEVDINRFHYQF
jgi:Sulfotransferase family